MTFEPETQAQIRARQQARARVMAILLGLFALLVFAISIAKMQINQ